MINITASKAIHVQTRFKSTCRTVCMKLSSRKYTDMYATSLHIRLVASNQYMIAQSNTLIFQVWTLESNFGALAKQ
jgi:hypothetical protein